MRVVMVSAVFPPEPVTSAQTSADIAQGMAGLGQAVEVVTAFPSRPAGKLYPGYSRRLFQRERSSAGYDVIRCFTLLSRKSGMLSRFGENISFGLTSSLAVLRTSRPDVIYANTWPLFATGLLCLAAKLRGVPLVISVQDLYPESLIIQGRIRPGGWRERWLRWIDRMIAQNSHYIITISERFAETYRHNRGVQVDRLHVIPNWTDGAPGVSDEASLQIRAECGLAPDAFLIVYGGSIGAAAGVEGVIDAFRFLPNAPPVFLLVAGSGPSLPTCQTLVRQMADTRVVFYTPWATDKTAAVYGAANVLVLPTRGQQSLASMPSKFISYMLAGRPIIAQAMPDSDLARTIEEAGCGWVVPPDQPEELARTILEVMSVPYDELRRRGTAGRDYALGRFTRSACLPRIIQVLDQAAKTHIPAPML